MGKQIPKGKTNEQAYVTYRLYVEPELHDLAVRNHLLEFLLTVDQGYILTALVGTWSPRYSRRMEAIDRWKIDNLDPVLADVEAKDILVARHRAHNALHRLPADFTDEQLARLNRSPSFKLLDVSSLSEAPSYGPSLTSLWTDAKAMGLPDEEAAERILDWAYHTPPAWWRDDERKKKKLPMIDKAVQARLRQRVAWRPTGELFIPWNSHVDGQRWEVRINDFPEEYMYSLLIDGTVVGDFHDWPEAWDRGSAKLDRPATIAAALLSLMPRHWSHATRLASAKRFGAT